MKPKYIKAALLTLGVIIVSGAAGGGESFIANLIGMILGGAMIFLSQMLSD